MTPKETTVEWLYNRFLFAGYAAPTHWKEQALKMEKEQIINAHQQGWSDAYDYYITEADSYSCAPIQADDYYNETYQNK